MITFCPQWQTFYYSRILFDLKQVSVHPEIKFFWMLKESSFQFEKNFSKKGKESGELCS